MTKQADPTGEWLRTHGFRVTVARRAVVELLEGSPLPLALPQMQRELPEHQFDFSTLFRFVEALEAKGLLERIPWIDGTIRCHLRDEHHHRHYLVCRRCQQAESVEDCSLGRAEHRLESKCGYADVGHVLFYTGLCPLCQSTPSKEKSQRPLSSHLPKANAPAHR